MQKNRPETAWDAVRGGVVSLLFRGQERLLLAPRNPAACALQQVSRLLQTLAPSPEHRGTLPCRGAEPEFRVRGALPPDFTILPFRQFVNALGQFQDSPQSGRLGSSGDLREHSEIDSEDLPLGVPLLPHGEFPEAGGDAVAFAVSLFEPPNKQLNGRFVSPELRTSRDRRCFRLFKDHLFLPTPVKKRPVTGAFPLWEGSD